MADPATEPPSGPDPGTKLNPERKSLPKPQQQEQAWKEPAGKAEDQGQRRPQEMPEAAGKAVKSLRERQVPEQQQHQPHEEVSRRKDEKEKKEEEEEAGGLSRVAGKAAETASELGQAPLEGAAAGLDTIESAVVGFNDQILQPTASWAWWLGVTLPYNTAAKSGTVVWGSTKRAADIGVQSMRWVVVKSSVPITNLSDAAYRYTLKALQRANIGMDGLVSETPRLIRTGTVGDLAHRETLGSAAFEAGAAQKDESGKPRLPEATDVAREANQALHRVFHKDDVGEEDAKGTLLMEARLLVWHAWLLVGLQVTALRSMLQVMEGMFTWVTAAWVQLATGFAVLMAMAAIAPLAGGAAAVAWASHFVLTQILSLRTYEEAIRSYWAPPLHGLASGMQEALKPYLQVPQQEEREGAGEPEQPPAAPLEGVEEESIVDNVLSTMSQAAKLGGGLLMSTVNANKSRLAAALATMEHYTRLLLPQEQKKEEGEPIEGTKADLMIAADSALEAWQRASSLAAAATWTVLDAARVLIIATAQRFMLPLPMWVLSPSASAQQLSQTPSIEEFNLAAGRGPSSTQEAMGSGAHAKMEQQQQQQVQQKEEQQQQQVQQEEQEQAGQERQAPKEEPGPEQPGTQREEQQAAVQEKSDSGKHGVSGMIDTAGEAAKGMAKAAMGKKQEGPPQEQLEEK